MRRLVEDSEVRSWVAELKERSRSSQRGPRPGTQSRRAPGTRRRRHHRDRHLPTISPSSQIPPSTPDGLAETADLIKGLNCRVVTAQVDVRDHNALKAVVDSGVDQLGRLDIICANAGIGNGGRTLDKTTEEDWQDMIDVNLSGVWKTVKASVPHLISQGQGGSIILTSSVGGLKAYPHTGHCIAAKHGVVGLMRTFAVELGQHLIRVNSVHPTNVNTPMFMNEGTMKLFRPDLENPGPVDLKAAAQFMHVLPVGWVEPVDISNAVLFLASDESRYITGLPVTDDAGSMLK